MDPLCPRSKFYPAVASQQQPAATPSCLRPSELSKYWRVLTARAMYLLRLRQSSLRLAPPRHCHWLVHYTVWYFVFFWNKNSRFSGPNRFWTWTWPHGIEPPGSVPSSAYPSEPNPGPVRGSKFLTQEPNGTGLPLASTHIIVLLCPSLPF